MNETNKLKKYVRIKRYWRFMQGIKKPHGYILFIMLTVVFIISMYMYVGAVVKFIIHDSPLSTALTAINNILVQPNDVPIMSHFVMMLLILFAVYMYSMIMFGTMVVIGTPSRAKYIDEGVASALRKKKRHTYEIPFIISTKRIAPNVKEYVFWSKYVPLTIWQTDEIKASISTVLDCTRIGEPKNGTRRKFYLFGTPVKTYHIVVFRAYGGAEVATRSGLIDDAL
ncbi:MAG: hypothetical protein FWB87_15580 [Defluviitaleaceae bacterium]|nr:hypothetical protein [Defluviitaleaceae bacterium]